MIRPTVIITGAAVRLGKATATAFFERGCNLVLHYNQSKSAAEMLMDSFNQKRANSCQIIQANLNHNYELEKLINATLEKFEQITHLVNNASAFYPEPILEQKESLNDFMQVNFLAPKKLAEIAHPHLKKSQGSVVNLIDIYADSGLTEHTSYVSSKAALLGASRDMAKQFSPEVRVNSVSPGAILWPPTNSSQTVSAEKQKNILDNTAIKQLGKPESIAATVCYLALDANYTTGSQIKVDGGRQWYI